MKNLLSTRRFELVALGVATLLAAIHLFAETTPVLGAGHSQAGKSGLIQALLRGVHVLEGRLTDIQFRIRGPRAPHPDVLVVEVDEKSAKEHGLWPWPRDVVGRGIQNLHDAGAAAIGLDIAFTDDAHDAAGEVLSKALSEVDAASASASGEQAVVLAGFKQRLEALRGPSPDEVLAGVFKRAPSVVQGVVMYNEESLADMGEARVARHQRDIQSFLIKQVQWLGKPGLTLEGVLPRIPALRRHGAETPLSAFVVPGSRVGFFDVVPDPDGSMRRVPPFAYLESGEGALASLEVEVAAKYFGGKPELAYDKELNLITSVWIPREGRERVEIPLQISEPYALVNHVGTREVFKTLSFGDVVSGNFDRAAVKGKAVIVGVTQIGNFDQRVTPFSEFEPGVFTHAAFLSNILDQRFLQRPWYMRGLELAFMVLGGLALAFVLPRVRFSWKLVAIAVALGGWMVFDQLAFDSGLQVSTLLPAGSLVITSFAVIFVGYLSADTERQRLGAAFQYRVGQKVMQEMLTHPEKFKQGGERKELSVLFSDIRGFTSIAERMSPDELSKFINEYLTPMTDIVFETDGTLDKYIGDAVMAFWGAPTDQPDHAQRACRAALRMLEKLEELKKEWRAAGRPDFDIGVGINTGPMSVGFMGSKVRGDYTVMGDAVNLASRLEGTNKEYETRVLISEGTYEQVKGEFVARRLGAVRVKGKRRPVRIYELRGFGQPQGGESEAIAGFEAALDLYAERRFEEAEAKFRRVLELWPNDPPSQRYLEELEVFKVTPPGPGWDGVYTATTK